MIHLGTIPSGSTLYIPFATYGGTNGESITCSGLAVTDIEIYKNGSTTQRASDSGYTLLDTDGIDFDGITGIHGFSVDLSDNSDAGFYSVGAFYWVVVSAITVDSQTVNFIAATFRIGPAESVTGYTKVDVDYVEGTDATNQIRDSVVDDSTRIDASALNTLSGHDPGETIAGATDTMDANIVNIANDAISAAAIAAAAVTKIQSGLALEATLTEIKGAGFTTQTLVAIKAAIDAIDVSGVADAVLDEAMAGHVTAGTLGYYMRMMYGLAVGRLKIDDTTKQLILYMPDGTTELARWNLYNAAGALASVNIFDRQRV